MWLILTTLSTIVSMPRSGKTLIIRAGKLLFPTKNLKESKEDSEVSKDQFKEKLLKMN